ncbi:MAG: NUDIX domain-containing protein [Candidatus Nanoarchaeia archaeon]|nr:NUDIX domain-containing protein [Candidatus Nanoarchaeia archaeon]
MDKMDKQIMVIERMLLFNNDEFQGFKSHHKVNYESRILSNLKYIRRGDAEEDPSHKQPIGYALVVNPSTKKVFAYQRASKDKHYTEKRLQGKWSWGVGGHIDLQDSSNGNPIKISLLRELKEELEMPSNINVKTLGYVNDDSDKVGEVHFGILYLIEVQTDDIKPKAKEMSQGKMISLSELEEICNNPECNVEGWSKIAIEPLKEYFNSKN